MKDMQKFYQTVGFGVTHSADYLGDDVIVIEWSTKDKTRKGRQKKIG